MVTRSNKLRCTGVASPCALLRPGLLGLLLCCAVAAEEPSDWAKIAQNPMADIIKMPIENHFDFGYGHKDQVRYRMQYKPSMVSGLSEHWNMVNRLDIPFVYQPGTVPGEKDSFGFGDTTYESFYGPAGERVFYWGFGPAFQIPTATDNQLGNKKWSAGIGGTGTLVKGPLVAGVRANHLWSFAGDKNRPDVNLTTIEYYLYANLGNGWWIGTSPVNTVDWEADEAWTIPLGGGFGKVITNGRRPVSLSLEAYTDPEAPQYEADWSLMLNIEFLFTPDSLLKQSR